MDWLHTDGIYVKDSSGRAIAWRGVMVGPYWYYWGAVVDQRLIDLVKQHGAAYIEAGISWIPGDLHEVSYARLDALVDLCEANDMRLVFNYLKASTELLKAGHITGWQDCLPIAGMKVLVERYKNRPVVCGLHLIDEPNFAGSNERQMYLNAISELFPINPNLLWITGVISYLRLGWSDDRLVWRAGDAPPNTIMQGQHWSYPEYLPFDNYALVDANINEIMSIVEAYRNKVQIPVGMGWGTDYLDSHLTNNDNSHTYHIRELARRLEERKMHQTIYVSEYFWTEKHDMPAIMERLLPDAPYPDYWTTPVSPALNLIVPALAMGGVTYAASKNPLLSVFMAALGGLGSAALTRSTPSPEGFTCEVCGALLEVPEDTALGVELVCPRCESIYQTTIL